MQAEALLSCGLISALSMKLANTDNPTVIKNLCFACSNIAAGNSSQIQRLIDGNIFPQLVQMFQSMEKQSQIEVLHVFNNATCCGDKDQLKSLESFGLIEIFYLGLLFDEDKALRQSLEGLLFASEQHVIDTKGQFDYDFSACCSLLFGSQLQLFSKSRYFRNIVIWKYVRLLKH